MQLKMKKVSTSLNMRCEGNKEIEDGLMERWRGPLLIKNSRKGSSSGRGTEKAKLFFHFGMLSRQPSGDFEWKTQVWSSEVSFV